MKNRDLILIILVALLVSAGFTAAMLAREYAVQLGASEIARARAENSLSKPWDLTPERSLSRATMLMPGDLKPLRGGMLDLDLFWILAQTKPGDPRYGEDGYQLWTVNVATGEKHLVTEHVAGAGMNDLGYNYLTGVDAKRVANNVLKLQFNQPWVDPPGTGFLPWGYVAQDFLKGSTGELLATAEYPYGGMKISNASGTLSLKYATSTPCGTGEYYDGDSTRLKKLIPSPATVTGLMVNDTEIMFKEPHQVQCSWDVPQAFAQTEFYPSFWNLPPQDVTDAWVKSTNLRFPLPWGEVVNVDLTNITPAGVTILPAGAD